MAKAKGKNEKKKKQDCASSSFPASRQPPTTNHQLTLFQFAEQSADARDLVFVEGPVDVLDHAAPLMGYGSKMGIDATAKWKSEGYEREWPEPIVMDEETKRYIDSIWEKLGIPK